MGQETFAQFLHDIPLFQALLLIPTGQVTDSHIRLSQSVRHHNAYPRIPLSQSVCHIVYSHIPSSQSLCHHYVYSHVPLLLYVTTMCILISRCHNVYVYFGLNLWSLRGDQT